MHLTKDGQMRKWKKKHSREERHVLRAKVWNEVMTKEKRWVEM